MAAYYFDASAIVKRYVAEVGTGTVQTLLDPAASHDIYIAIVGAAEVAAAIARRGRSGNQLTDEASEAIRRFQEDCASRWTIIEITPDLMSEVIRLVQSHLLRGYDAVHLAAALQANRIRQEEGLSELILVSSDQQLNAAAIAEHLTVLDPNNE